MNRILRTLLAWSAVLLVLWLGASFAWSGRGMRPALLVNGLDETVTVEIDGNRRAIAAGAFVRMQLKIGAHEVQARTDSDGRVLDRHRIVVPKAGLGTGIYSVLGAAPLYRVEARFRRIVPVGGIPGLDAAGRPSFHEYTELAGPRFQLVDADHYFQPSPDDLRPSWMGTAKKYLGCFGGDWRTGMGMALASAPDAEAGALLARLQRARPEDRQLAWARFAFASTSGGSEAAVAIADEGLHGAPGSAAAHEVWATAMRVAGRTAELRARARALAAGAPDDPLATAGLLDVLPRRDADALARTVAAGQDRDPALLRAAASVLLRAGRPAAAAALYGELPLQESSFAGSHVRALLQAGDAKGAAAMALQVAKLEAADASDLARYLQAAALPGAAPEVEPEALLAEWAKKDREQAQIASALAGLTSRPPQSAPARDHSVAPLVEWAVWDPREALARCREATPGLLALAPRDVGSVLALEAYRLGDRVLFERLRWSLRLGAEEVAAYVDRGVEPEDGWRLDAPDRAALALARARTLQASGAPVPEDVLRAVRADPLGGAAALAAERWPAPEPGSPPVVLVLQPGR